MEYRILGPLEVSTDGELLPLGPVKQRALLAVLLLSSGKTVSRDRLIDELWGEEAPKTASKAIQNYVSRLRKLLPPETLVTRTPGYVAELAPDELDLTRFEQLVDDGRKALSSGEFEQSAALLREALELWRGPALVEFESEPFAQTEGLRLEELRLSALEERIEADLSLGRHAELVGELEALVARHPLRERLRGQLMLALYRSGRQAEALTAYQDARSTLVDELGIDPSRQLQDLEQAILRHDPALESEVVPSFEAAAVEQEAAAAPARLPTEFKAATPPPRRSVTKKLEGQGSAFVGRRAELERLQAVLGDVLAGRGRLVMLAGEPGIGKTRIALELAALAEERGARILSGRCFEREGAPPYWPWVEAIRSFLASEPPDRLRAELGSGGAVIAEMVPEVHEWLPDLEPPQPLSDLKQARFRLLDATASFLKRVAERQAVVVVLDDLHAADAGTLMLLEFVAHELSETPLLVVGAYRDVGLARGHPLSQTLAELSREQLFERISLGGLSEGDVGRYIELSLGVAASEELVDAVHSQTEGNPLFVSEVVRLLEQEGRLTPEAVARQTDWTLAVPEGVREVIGRRLDGLSDECNEMLRLASVIGREFGLDQLQMLIKDRSEEELLDPLEEALLARVVDEQPEPAQYEFTHALVREVLVDELSATRRARLHAQIAQALEKLYAPDAEAHAAELAHHFGEAESILGSDKLVHYSQAAAERALRARAYGEATAHFERALAAREGQPADAQAADLLFGLARSELGERELFDLGEVVDHFCLAFDYFVEAKEAQRAVEVAAHPFPPVYVSTELPDRIDRALSMVTPGSLDEGRLLSNRGWYTGTHQADHARAHDAFERSLEIAQRLGDGALERRVLVNAAQVDYWHLRWQDCWDEGAQAAELAVAASDQHTEMVAREWLARVAMVRGEPGLGQSQIATAVELAERLRERSWLATTHILRGSVCMLEGDWQAARAFSDHGLHLQPREPRNLAIRALLEFQVGDFRAGESYLDRLLDPARRDAWGLWDQAAAAVFIPLIAVLTGRSEGVDVAETEAEAALSSTAAPFMRHLWPRIGLGLLSVLRDDAASAAENYSWFEQHRGIMVLGPYVAVDRLLGLLSQTMGEAGKSAAHFEDALAFCERAGYRPEYAWTASDYAEALLKQAAAGDREGAIALQEEALAIARELDMQPLAERILASQQAPKA